MNFINHTYIKYFFLFFLALKLNFYFLENSSFDKFEDIICLSDVNDNETDIENVEIENFIYYLQGILKNYFFDKQKEYFFLKKKYQKKFIEFSTPPPELTINCLSDSFFQRKNLS